MIQTIRSAMRPAPPPPSKPPLPDPVPTDTVGPSLDNAYAKLGAYAGMGTGTLTGMAVRDALGFMPLTVVGPITGILVGAGLGASLAKRLHADP